MSTKRQTLEIGVSSTFGCMPMEVVFARIISFSGWKLLSSSRDKASAPTTIASSRARSSRNQTEHQYEVT